MNQSKYSQCLGLCALLCCLLLTGCGGGGGGSDTPDPAKTVTVTGLASQESDALADAGTVVKVGDVTSVVFSPPKALGTGELYNFQITVPLTASKGSFAQGSTVNEFPLTATPGVSLTAGSLDIGTVYVGANSGICQVTGRVVNTKSVVVPSAIVKIGKFMTTTAADGTFNFVQAPAWFNSVTISASGYDTRTIMLDNPLTKSISNNLGDLHFQDDITDDPPPPPF
ncbi:MAG: carboxypeptidase-like regulatory domain-containing protein [Armatimonadota bacterium]